MNYHSLEIYISVQSELALVGSCMAAQRYVARGAAITFRISRMRRGANPEGRKSSSKKRPGLMGTTETLRP